MNISRRKAARCLAGATASALALPTLLQGATPSPWKIAVFAADVTVPLGHGMMGGSWLSRSVADPLEARGWILSGPADPIVFCSVDWCEIRNDAYQRWKEVLAHAAGTSPSRVMLTTIHQHDAPVADLTAEAILRERQLQGTACDPAFHELAVQRVATAVRQSLHQAQPCTHVGIGQAPVLEVASNRRYTMPDGSIRFDRTSSTRNAFAIAGEVGLIDDKLKTLSFWNQDQAIAATSFYAVHPMSYYGQGEISADFPGLARRKRQAGDTSVFQIYSSGCSGNVTAGKYNNGDRSMRVVLADRIHNAMIGAWSNTRKFPIQKVEYRDHPFTLTPRESAGFTEAELQSKLTPDSRAFAQCLAAMGLSWRKRVASGVPLSLPCLDLGDALITVLPGESYLEFQIAAQKLRPDSFVCVAGYGDGATGYVPTERHWEERDTNLGDWCWVERGSESKLLQALEAALAPKHAAR